MDFSIIIINYRTKDLLDACLASIFAHAKGSYEIIVIDNASQDGSIEFIREKYSDRILIKENKKNLGFGAANNIGAKLAQGKYLLFLNSDTVITDDILCPIYQFFCSDNKISIVSPKLVLPNGKNQPHAFGKFPNFLTLFSGRFLKEKEYLSPIEVDWVGGTAMFIKRDVFLEIGEFDENYFMYYEDIDICRRITNIGSKIYLYPDSKVIHHVAGSSSNLLNTKLAYYNSQHYYFQKYHGFIYAMLISVSTWPLRMVRIAKSKMN